MALTPMLANGDIDEDGLRRHLRRLAAAGIGVYVGSGGTGEGHAMTVDELGRLYSIAVSECGGIVPVYCNPPESRSANEQLDKARRGIEVGVDAVRFNQLDAGHGRMPVLAEQERYFRDLLEATDYPVALSIHSAVGYLAPSSLVVRLCHDYPQIKLINLHGPEMDYYLRLRDGISEDVKLYVGIHTLISGLVMGAWGVQMTEANQIPNLCRLVVDRFSMGDVGGAAEAYGNVLRVSDIVWMGRNVSADGPKAAMRALGYDVGPPRPPRLPIGDEVLDDMRRAFERLHIADLEEKAAQERPFG